MAVVGRGAREKRQHLKSKTTSFHLVQDHVKDELKTVLLNFWSIDRSEKTATECWLQREGTTGTRGACLMPPKENTQALPLRMYSLLLQSPNL